MRLRRSDAARRGPTLAALALLAVVAAGHRASVAHAAPPTELPSPDHADVLFASAPLDEGGLVPLHLSLWLPPANRAGEEPLVVWVPDRVSSDDDYASPPAFVLALRSRGIAVASVEYRSPTQAVFPAQVHDLKAALRYLRASAPIYGLNPGRIGIAGIGGGGHLAILVAESGGVADLEGSIGHFDSVSSRVECCVGLAAPIDYLALAFDAASSGLVTSNSSGPDPDAAASPGSHLLGFDGEGQGIGILRANLDSPERPFRHYARMANLANPTRLVTGDDPPLLLVHGASDTVVPIAQPERLREARAGLRLTTEWMAIPKVGHEPLPPSALAAAQAYLLDRLGVPAGDASGDGEVDSADLDLVLDSWGPCAGCAADLNGDEIVDGRDVGLVLATWSY